MANETESKTQPLISLEYCSLDRASRLLGCEVEDIFHWAATGAITLYAQFQDFKYSSGESFLVDDIYVNDHILTYEEYQEFEVWHDGKPYVKRTPVNNRGPIHIYDKALRSDPECFSFGAAMWLSEPGEGFSEREVSLSGFWEVDSASISQMLLPTQGQDEAYWCLRAIYTGDIPLAKSKVGISLCAVALDNMPSRLRVMHGDLLKIKRELIDNELTEINFSEQCPTEPSPAADIVPTVRHERVTSKQCRFIVDLLKSHGLNDEDFKGSIGALRLKMANKIPEIGDPSLDDNTLSDWLRKAGAR